MKSKRVERTGTSSCYADIEGRFKTLRQANAAWYSHYEQRRENGCQRRNRLISEAQRGVVSELNELYAEMERTNALGFKLTKAAVADEAGDVWYGVRAYAQAWKEQSKRALSRWRNNLMAARLQHQRITAPDRWSAAMPIDELLWRESLTWSTAERQQGFVGESLTGPM